MLGKTAVITGNSRRIGRAIALTYAREGADIAICARNASDLTAVADEVKKLGRRCWFQGCDVTVKEEAFVTVESALKQLGKIDILVNNAGGGAVPDYRTFLEMTTSAGLTISTFI